MSMTQYSKQTAIWSHHVSNSHDVKKKKNYVTITHKLSGDSQCFQEVHFLLGKFRSFGLMVVTYNVYKKWSTNIEIWLNLL